ncbi:MAG: hypothetical protein JW722_04095 [Demequinaceae bacterium]|nr:hypothetical protein [Demequinaceae bacterium]
MGKGGRALLALGSVLSLALGASGAYFFGPTLLGMGDGDHARKVPLAEIRVERSERAFPLSGVVMADGIPMDDATVMAGGQSVYTDATGAFSFEHAPLGTVTVARPGFETLEYTFDGSVEEVDLVIEERIIRGIRVPPLVAKSDTEFQKMIDIADQTSVNAFVFDTKGDYDYAGAEGVVFYETEVEAAQKPGLVVVWYDPVQRLQQAKDAGIYTITRIPVFISQSYVDAYPQHKLVGRYLDPGNRDAWEYALDLAVEACELGFDEIQFDYIRYPDGQAATTARNLGLVPNEATRVATIQAFLEEASGRLHPLGCAVSADIFGIVNVEDDDAGLGQKVEEISVPLDIYVPMIYPNQWPSGYFGLNDPSDHPSTVVGSVLDTAAPRLAPGTIMRPLLQGYYYSPSQIRAEIDAAESRGFGWQIWNMDGIYSIDSFPAGTTGAG